MTIEYQGKTYTVGRRYKIELPLYRLRTDNDDKRIGTERVWCKLVLKKYADGEGYGDYYHYGFVFEYKRTWRGVERVDEITFPDAIGE